MFKSLRPYARAIAPLITTVQILQMAVGTAVTVRSAQLHYQGLRCAAGAYTRPLFSPQGGVNIHYSGERMMRTVMNDAYGSRTCVFMEWGCQQGLTLVHFSAQRKHILWDAWGA